MDPAMDLKARRVKDLLSSYYGSEGGTGPDGASGSGSADGQASKMTGVRASGIDSATFDADRFIRSLLKGTRLDGLMSKHVEMSTEIKSLDGDMQMLVYENYNKFISATDIIRNMKSNVDGMGSNMDELMTTIDSVAERSNAVNSKLQRRRDHIEELNRVRSLLKKIEVVFDLPKKLRAAIDNDALEIAVQQYSAAAPVLKRFGHQGAFRAVASSTAEIAKEVVAALRRRLMERKDEAAECIQMLRLMGEPVESLQEDYLECRRVRMEAVLEQAIAVVEVMCKAAGMEYGEHEAQSAVSMGTEVWGLGPDGEPPMLGRLVVNIDSRFLGEVVQTVSSFGELFPDNRKRLLEVLKELFARYFGVLRLAISASAACLANTAAGLPDPQSEMTEEEMPGPLTGDWGGIGTIHALSTLKTDLGRMTGLLPELSLQDRASEVIEAAVRHHVGACFRALEYRLLMEVQVACKNIESLSSAASVRGASQGQALLKAQDRIAGLLREAPQSVLAGMRELLDEGARLLDSWRDVYVDLVQGSLQNLFLALLDHFLVIAGAKPALQGGHMRYGSFGSNLLFPSTPNHSVNSANSSQIMSPAARAAAAATPFSPFDMSFGTPAGAAAVVSTPGEPAPPGMVLLLACLCTFMESNLITFCMEQLAGRFPGSGGGGGGDQPPAFVAGELARRINAAASSLLASYVESHGRKLSLMVRRSVESNNWMKCKEPRAPRAVCVLLLDRLAVAEAEVVQLIDGGGQRGSASGGKLKSQDSRGNLHGAASLERNVAKLFTERVKIFGSVEFSQGSVLGAIARVGIKSLVECVRLQTLGRAGLQQLQLDVHYLRPQLRQFTPASASVDSLLDEVLGAAIERSTDPTLLEPGLLDRIVANSAKTNEFD